MPNPGDITDPKTTMNMALVLMAKAFKLNYSTPTNNNQRISSNPRNQQIVQPGMNMGQDRQMRMVGANGGHQFRQYAGQNVGYQNGYNAVQNVGNQERIEEDKKDAKTIKKPTRNERDKNKSEETTKDQSRISPTQQERQSKVKGIKSKDQL
ncbi:hypothetical protein Tco_0468109 [Tanacetum coccineum]